MASQAQIDANRKNAEKSTGPKTAEGKAAVSRNAVKHGFFSRDDVTKDEDQADLDRYRLAMLVEMSPVGVLESTLAERIIRLSWRLRRAERMQDQSLKLQIHSDRLDRGVREPQGLFNGLGGLPQEESKAEDDPMTVGRAGGNDIAKYRMLDKLLMYERRIESSMHKTLNELRKVQAARKAEEASGGKTNSAAEPHSPRPAESESPEHTTPACDHNSDCAKQTQSAPARHDAKLTVSRTCDDKPLVVKVQNKPNQSQSASQPEPCESAESEIATAHRASSENSTLYCRKY